MIKANVGFYSLITEVTKIKKMNVDLEENSDINYLFEILFDRFGDDFEEMIFPNDPGKLNSRIIVMINDKNILDKNGLNTLINSGDEIAFLPAIAGG